jgi:hypothetical protein
MLNGDLHDAATHRVGQFEHWRYLNRTARADSMLTATDQVRQKKSKNGRRLMPLLHWRR